MNFDQTRKDLLAGLGGLVVFVLLLFASATIIRFWRDGECHGESTPVLGSTPQVFVVPFCLAENEGWKVGLKKAVRIYDTAWKIVIRRATTNAMRRGSPPTVIPTGLQ